MITQSVHATLLQILGAGGFGLVMGWYVYYINRYRKTTVQLSDLVTLISALGGAGILALFPARTDLFGAYGIGICLGFFSYFAVLLMLVRMSKNFDIDWFLDGRRKRAIEPYFVPPGIDTPPSLPMDAAPLPHAPTTIPMQPPPAV
jgi:hypothetical protein